MLTELSGSEDNRKESLKSLEFSDTSNFDIRDKVNSFE